MKKKILTLAFISIFCFAEVAMAGKLKTPHGYWNFNGIAEVVDSSVQVIVNNQSTDDSYGSSRCKKGMASCKVYVELWHSDAGRLGGVVSSFRDICNGRSAKKIVIKNIPRKYKRLRVKYRITTPNGGHIFTKGSTNWNR